MTLSVEHLKRQLNAKIWDFQEHPSSPVSVKQTMSILNYFAQTQGTDVLSSTFPYSIRIDIQGVQL